MTALSVILPANNEADWIGDCLESLFASTPIAGGAEVIVVANGCKDATAARALSYESRARAAGWRLVVLDLPQGGKLHALNQGDAQAQGRIRAYLDADVRLEAPLLAALVAQLSAKGALYGSGRPQVAPAKSRLTRAYARFWQKLPFARSVAPGFGLFAVNAEGRARWGAYPAIISDDTFVRLHFTPAERREVPFTYSWPMVEGFTALVKVRRRQDAGVQELARNYPQLLANEGKAPLGAKRLLGLGLRDPLGFGAYALVSLAVRLRGADGAWTRGR